MHDKSKESSSIIFYKVKFYKIFFAFIITECLYRYTLPVITSNRNITHVNYLYHEVTKSSQ